MLADFFLLCGRVTYRAWVGSQNPADEKKWSRECVIRTLLTALLGGTLLARSALVRTGKECELAGQK
jgi:hypothetical protein